MTWRAESSRPSSVGKPFDFCSPCLPIKGSLGGWFPRKFLVVLDQKLVLMPYLVSSSCCEFCPWFAAATAAKSLQSCLTLCDPIDGSPPGSPIPGILQARTLEWVAISFSNAWKWKVKVQSLSRVWPSATPRTTAFQAPPSMEFSRLLRPWDFPGKSIGEGCHCLLLGLQRLIKMHWLFCSFTGESRGFPRANPVPFEAGPVIHVVGLWFSSAVLFCVKWRRCAEWRYRQNASQFLCSKNRDAPPAHSSTLFPSRDDGFVWVLSCCQSGESDWISVLTKMSSTGASHIDWFLTGSPGVFLEERIAGTCPCVLSVVVS